MFTEYAAPLSMSKAPDAVEFFTSYGANFFPVPHSTKFSNFFFAGALMTLNGSQPCLNAAAIVKALNVDPAWKPTVPFAETGAP